MARYSDIITVHATDPDPGLEGQVRYRLDNSSGLSQHTNKFLIDENTGRITNSETIRIEDGPVIQLVVEAYDQSKTFRRKSQTVVMLEIRGEGRDHLDFNPLPKIVFISTDKPVGSTIIT